MSKRIILNSDEFDEFMTPKRNEQLMSGTRISKRFKNSLDSDEEDDEEKSEKYNILNPDELAGEEESTIDHDGEISITPFNMKEELEEGYFDKEGTYIFKNKNEEEIKDSWLDNIDWVKVKRTHTENLKPKTEIRFYDSDEDLPNLNVIEHYMKMVEIMEPGETVQKAIRRLGGGTSKDSRRSSYSREKEKSQSKLKTGENSTKQELEKLQTLTELANDIVQNGNMDIYEETFERLSFFIKGSEDKKSSSHDALDMFGESFKEDPSDNQNVNTENTNSSSELEVMWEFKWESKDDAPVYGPHSTSEMLGWVQEGYFADGVFVRQVGKQDSQFYSSKRIDFDLYL